MPNLIHEGVRKRHDAALRLLARVVFPPTCAGCNVAGSWLCDRCRVSLVDLRVEPGNERSDSSGMDGPIMARYLYEEPVRRAIHLLKYDGQRSRARWFAAELLPLLEAISADESVLQPVPLSPARLKSRGFNQSREICLSLASMSGLQVINGIERIRDTRPQVELRGEDRIVNVRGAFRASRSVAGRDVILVDDVVTTGATMGECTRACYAAGAARVSGLAVATGQ